MSAASEPRLTNADLEAMPEYGNRYKVIDGELFMSGTPDYTHQGILVNIFCPMGICQPSNQLRDRHVKLSLNAGGAFERSFLPAGHLTSGILSGLSVPADTTFN